MLRVSKERSGVLRVSKVPDFVRPRFGLVDDREFCLGLD